MKDELFEAHLQRVKTQTISTYSLAMLADWICEHTRLRGAPYSYRGHEYQERIIRDPSREKVVRKPSQVGISEMSIRWALGVLHVLPESTAIFTQPTATAAKNFSKTRVDPIIRSSPTLTASVNTTTDNAEVKNFSGSFLYIRGTVGMNAAISIPADCIISDEVDFSSQTVLSSYQSRLTHSPHKLWLKLSTPTVEQYGISAAFASSRRHWNFVRCNHCNFFFIPDYYEHVQIPGFTGSLKEITRDNIHKLRTAEAHLACPKCGGTPDLQPAHREWVLENPNDTFVAAGYQVTPFDAPSTISCADLIASSVKYSRVTDFINFSLGLPAEDKDTTISRADVESCYVQGEAPSFGTHVFAADMGMLCHILIGGIDGSGNLLVVHTEIVPISRFKERKETLCREYRVSLSVMDSQPYFSTLLELQDLDPNLYGTVYVKSKSLEIFTLKKKEEDADKGQADVRMLSVNRNKALDALVGFIRSGNFAVLADANKETLIQHFCDMKRIRDFSAEEEELSYVWQKSERGADHFFHTALYLYIAMQLRGVSRGMITLPSYVGSFKVKTMV